MIRSIYPSSRPFQLFEKKARKNLNFHYVIVFFLLRSLIQVLHFRPGESQAASVFAVSLAIKTGGVERDKSCKKKDCYELEGKKLRQDSRKVWNCRVQVSLYSFCFTFFDILKKLQFPSRCLTNSHLHESTDKSDRVKENHQGDCFEMETASSFPFSCG